MRNRAIVASLFLLAAFTGERLSAQTVRGRLVDGISRTAVSGALAELRDADGKLVQQVFSSSTGAFLFTPPANQTYQLRVAAIGFARHANVTVTLASEPVVVADIMLTPVVVTLPELRALSGKRACGKSELNPETFGGLLESANTSLRVMDATLRSAQLGFQIQRVHRVSSKTTGKDSTVSADTIMSSIHDWPVRSLSLDSLRAVGFQRRGTEEEGYGYHYYGPDIEVLFSDWFLDNHCFTLDKGRSKGDTVVIRFDPHGKSKNVDISGELVLDRESLTLRRLTYTHRDLLDGIPDRSAGGEMHFAERSEGLWVPVDWAIWAPFTRMSRSISRPVMMAPGQRGSSGASRVQMAAMPQPTVQVVGRNEQRGRLVRIVPIGGS